MADFGPVVWQHHISLRPDRSSSTAWLTLVSIASFTAVCSVDVNRFFPRDHHPLAFGRFQHLATPDASAYGVQYCGRCFA